MVAMDAHAFHPVSERTADLYDGDYSPGRNHAQTAEPPADDGDRIVVNQANLAEPKFAIGELESSRFACLRKSPSMHPEAGRPIDLAQQPQIDLPEALHTPSDTLIVVDCIRSSKTCDGGKLVGHQSPGASAVKQFAEPKIKTESILRLLEPGLVSVKHAQPLLPNEVL
jgi:hypothetical protein